MFFFPSLDHFCLELSRCHCRGRGISGWAGSMYCFDHTPLFLRSFSKGLYTVGVGGGRGRHSVINRIDTCTDDDDDDDNMFM